MDQSTKEISLKGSRKDEGSLNGQMDKFMTANGKKEERMGVGCGKDLMEIHI